MQYDTMVLFNMTELPIREEHVAWNVTKESKEGVEVYRLTEIVKATYRHPQAPNDMNVSNLEERQRGFVNANALMASPYVLMFHAQQNVATVAKT
jgi:hypothetical protein